MEEEEEIGPAQSLLGGTEHVEEEEEDRASSDPARRNRARGRRGGRSGQLRPC